MPVEPPRPTTSTGQEVFARRSTKFAKSYQATPKKNAFSKASNKTPDSDDEPPAFTIDARVPHPAILTCNDTIPLRILVRKTNQSRAVIFLTTLTVELFAFTNIRAHGLSRTEAGSWILTSQANLNVPLGSSADPADKQYSVPKRYMDQIRLPPSVIPSFETCNISRSYELEVRVGLKHGQVRNIKVSRERCTQNEHD